MSCGGSNTSSGCCGGGSTSKDQINPSSSAEVYDSVKEYYGKRLQGSDDLKTSACTTGGSFMPKYIKQAIGEVHDEVVSRYYGCGLVVPQILKDTSVLDLGSGAGRDCYVVSKLVGENGRVVGVDMTEEQLEVARRHVEYHTQKFGHSKSNVEFCFGYIEKLGEAGLGDGIFDVIISNCVINLVPNKDAVLQEAYRVLRDGGELYFSDVYASEPVSEELRSDAVLWGECISGALHWEELIRLAGNVGFAPPRLVRAAPITMKNDQLGAKLGDLRFVSATYRLVKVPKPELDNAKPACVTYDGQAENAEESLEFDQSISFPAGKCVTVSAPVTAILRASRFSRHLAFSDVTCTASCAVQEPDLNPFILSDKSPASGGDGCCSGPSAKPAIEAAECGSQSCSTTAGCCPPMKKKCC